MKTNSKYFSALLIIIGIVIQFLIYGWFYIENEKEDHNNTISQINKKYENLQQNDLYRKLELQYNGKNISHFISDSNTVSELKNMIDNHKVILIVHEDRYNTETDIELENLSNNMQKFKGDIILLIKSHNKRFVSIFKQSKKIEYPCFHLQTNRDLSFVNIPVIYFMLEKETLRINASFIPHSDKKEETISYYEKIIADYYTKN